MSKKHFLKNAAILMLGKISTQLISIIVLPLYTAYLTTQEYGEVDLISTCIMFCIPLLSLQIERAAFRFLVSERSNTKKIEEIIATVGVFLIVSSLFFTPLALILLSILKVRNVFLVVLYGVLYYYCNTLLQILRGLNRNLDFAVSSVISGIMTLLFNVSLVVGLRMGVQGMLISYCASYVVLLFFLIIRLRLISIFFTRAWSINRLRAMLNYSVSLIPDSISWWIMDISDRVIVSFILGLESNGLYAIAGKFPSLFVGFFNVINMAWQDDVILKLKKNPSYVYENTVTIFRILIELSSVFILSLSLLFPFLINSRYSLAYWHIPILTIAGVFTIGLGLLQSIYMGLDETKKIAKTSSLCAVLNIAINLLLISKFGIFAASISTLIAYFAMFVYRLLDLKRRNGVVLDSKRLIMPFLLLMASTLVYCLDRPLISLMFAIPQFFVIFIFEKDYLFNTVRNFLAKKNR